MNKSEFKKAVADNEAPTPGYLYRDMANWTFADYATQLQLIKALFDKLQMKNSAFVLYKALHLIKVLCETGQEGFQKELQLSKYTSVVKDFTTYRGPLDIKYGDSWNEKVRCEAQSALEAIFQTRLAGSSGAAVLGGTGGDWSGTGSAAVEQSAVKGPWGANSRNSGAAGGHGDELVMPSFANLNPYSSGSAALQPPPPPQQQQQLGGLSLSYPSPSPAFDAPSLHIGEMPSENKWADRQREMAAIGGGSSTSEKPSKTLLQQLASTAKSGVNLMTQFEVLKGKQERLYGDQFGQAARATTGPDTAGSLSSKRRGVDEVGSYQPVGLHMPPPPVSTAVPQPFPPVPEVRAASACSTPAVAAPLAPPHTLPPHTPDASAFDFVSSPSSPPPSDSSDAATELLHAFARLKQTPSRVELSRLVRVVDESVTAQAHFGAASLDGYGVQLASALSLHLHKDRPWQERLNALASLEAMLRGCAEGPARQSVADFFRRQPYFVQVNYGVVQASLKEKAGKVAQLLSISPVLTAAAVAPPINSASGGGAPGQAAASASASQRSQFEPLLGGGGGSPSAAPPAQSASSLRGENTGNVSSSGDTFHGMTIRGATGGGSSGTPRRGDTTAAAVSSPPGEGNTSLLGGDAASRPQRRTNRSTAALSTDGSPAGQQAPSDGRGGGGTPELFQVASPRGGGSGTSAIQVVRSSAGPAATTAVGGQHNASQPQRMLPNDANNLDSLLGFSSTSVQMPTRAPATPSSALDDLFGGQPASGPHGALLASTGAGSGALHNTSAFTTDDLFGTAPSVAPPLVQPATVPQPTSSLQATSAAQLTRIQELMQYLETRYDPAAMRELETLIVSRQQELHQLTSQQQGYGEGAMPSAAGAQPHRQFQTGGARSGQGSERQQANHAFADVQAEMKRKMEL